MQFNCITGVIVDNGGTYDQSMWLAGKLLQTCFCNYDLKQKTCLKILMTASHFLFQMSILNFARLCTVSGVIVVWHMSCLFR